MKDIHLTIGHNVNGRPTHTTRAVCATAARILEVEGFTAVPCLGMWRGEAEDSTRLEICGLDDEAAVDDFAPMFYRVELRPGYYEGVQIAVTLEDDPRDMDDEQTLDAWGMDRARAIRALEIDTAALKAGLDEWAAAFGFTPLAVFARFSSGETWYSPVDTDERRAA